MHSYRRPMRQPAVEFHPQRNAIEADLVSGMPVRAVAEKYGIAKSAAQRHRDKMPAFVQLALEAKKAPESVPTPPRRGLEAVEKALEEGTDKGTSEGTGERKEGTPRDNVPSNHAAAVQELATQSGQSILEQVTAYNAAVLEIFTRCKEERPALALAAVREARGLLELQGKLLGDLKSETDVKIAIILPEGMRNANARG